MQNAKRKNAGAPKDGEGRPTRLGVTAQLRQQPSHLEACDVQIGLVSIQNEIESRQMYYYIYLFICLLFVFNKQKKHGP